MQGSGFFDHWVNGYCVARARILTKEELETRNRLSSTAFNAKPRVNNSITSQPKPAPKDLPTSEPNRTADQSRSTEPASKPTVSGTNPTDLGKRLPLTTCFTQSYQPMASGPVSRFDRPSTFIAKPTSS
ncbi:hypothetical protein CLAFUW4_14812 [Fulvia fulva]|nr:hypothetical protein CLAFUR0_14804 [Fulvia fulva]WPV23014.1 hypothetical protein CLAFUW4_14812 [Fulvia fulva]WPV37961.1 hypothetical protein CLAFUW7_14813 [Fulvia fulva]